MRNCGNPEQAAAYCNGVPIEIIARRLRRHPRTVRDWLTGRRKMPWWVPELLQLQHEAAVRSLREMGIPHGAPPRGSSIISEPDR
ncbi:MAG: hypothetical protein J0H00_10220 [Burkholderiales bacterium]|nr:hypothetical protein [Burkholderiales bacterium]OJX06640.1 MAG: hypothetical protein BGO72_16720 [Burkholderiales bacterium 70-64]